MNTSTSRRRWFFEVIAEQTDRKAAGRPEYGNFRQRFGVFLLHQAANHQRFAAADAHGGIGLALKSAE